MDERPIPPTSPARGPLSRPGTVLLETARPDSENRESLLFSDPLETLVARDPGEVDAVLAAAAEATRAGRYVAGFVAYEAGIALEPTLAGSGKPAARQGLPLVWLGVYDKPERVEAERIERLLGRASGAISAPRFAYDRETYVARVERIRGLIREGDVYQINFTGQVRFEVTGSPEALYRRLRARQRVAYGAFIRVEGATVLSCSPELFFRSDGDRILVRPMKGTTRRGAGPEEDDRLAARLAGDEKNRAENLMIVDLLRNDLSQVCLPGSVRTLRLFETERYETVTQMTSTIEGRLAPGAGLRELFRALFPCGSVTGAPKLRAMRRIGELEDEPRGVYCGAIGYAGPGRRAVFSVAIRTIVVRGSEGTMGSGSGIVWDSVAEEEYEECLLKARFLETPGSGPEEGPGSGRRSDGAAAVPDAGHERPALIETMRWEGSVPRASWHRERMQRSAEALGYPFDPDAYETALGAAIGDAGEGPSRVRITLDADGRFEARVHPLGPVPSPLAQVAIAAERNDAADPLLRHKTTRRARYEACYARARAEGFDEVLFLNERGEVTEGSRTNVFVRHGDTWFTPPPESGLLPGICRRALLEELPRASERVLRLPDLLQADEVVVCNAVWGPVAARVHAVVVGREGGRWPVEQALLAEIAS